MSRIPQVSMASGVISPELYAAVNQQFYQQALAVGYNVIIKRRGGAENRPGTLHVCPHRYPERKSRLRDFQYSQVQTYALEFGHYYMRVTRDGGQVVELSKPIVSITNTNPIVVEVTGHGFSNNDDVFFSGVGGMTQLNGRFFRVKNVTADTFELYDMCPTVNYPVSGITYGAFTSGGSVARVYTLETPWPEEDLPTLRFVQNKDVLTVLHEKHYPRDVSRLAHDNWTIGKFNNKEGPFEDINIDEAKTVYVAAATGATTATANFNLFTPDMVGELLYIEQRPDDTTPVWEVGKTIAINDIRRAGPHYYRAINAGTTGTRLPDVVGAGATIFDGSAGIQWEYLHSGYGIVQIDAYVSPTVANVTCLPRVPDLVVGAPRATFNWARAAWSARNGYPRTAAYVDQRFILAGSTGFPESLWPSAVDIRNFFGKSTPILADDAMKLKVEGLTVNEIRHLIPMSDLVALTSSSEWTVKGSNGPLIATENPRRKNQGYNGCSNVPPLTIGDMGLFVQDGSKAVYAISNSTSVDADTFAQNDLIARASHYTEDREIIDWSYQKMPNGVVWSVLSDGMMLSFTVSKEHQIFAWCEHGTDGLFESTCSLREGEEDAVYFSVKRDAYYNNGTIKDVARYIERFAFRGVKDVVDSHFVDSGVVFDGRNKGATTMTLSGGVNWDENESLTCVSSSPYFTASSVGTEVVFWIGNTAYRLKVETYISPTQVTVYPNRTVDPQLRNVATKSWENARKKIGGAWHLEGITITALGDGKVYKDIVVKNGDIELPDACAVIHAGRNMTSHIQSLTINAGADLLGMPKLIKDVKIMVRNTRGIEVGTSLDKTEPYKQRILASNGDRPYPLYTDTIEKTTSSKYEENARVVVRQSDPLPMHIIALMPNVKVGNDASQ